MFGHKKLKRNEFNMALFYPKQKMLINSWHSLSDKSNDAYLAFMSEWIAFNAICYGLYHEKAMSERAELKTRGQKLIQIRDRLEKSLRITAELAVVEYDNEKWNLDINLPEKLSLSISKKFTENLIYDRFVSEHKVWYRELPNINELFFDLKKASSKKIKGGERSFVVNMVRSHDFNDSNDIDKQHESGILVLCEKNELKSIKDVLYQIRCNIFHGEKSPNFINDDRFVKSALPLLRLIVQQLIIKHNIIDE